MTEWTRHGDDGPEHRLFGPTGEEAWMVEEPGTSVRRLGPDRLLVTERGRPGRIAYLTGARVAYRDQVPGDVLD